MVNVCVYMQPKCHWYHPLENANTNQFSSYLHVNWSLIITMVNWTGKCLQEINYICIKKQIIVDWQAKKQIETPSCNEANINAYLNNTEYIYILVFLKLVWNNIQIKNNNNPNLCINIKTCIYIYVVEVSLSILLVMTYNFI